MIPLDNVVLRRQLLERGRDKLKIYIGISYMIQRVPSSVEITSTPLSPVWQKNSKWKWKTTKSH